MKKFLAFTCFVSFAWAASSAFAQEPPKIQVVWPKEERPQYPAVSASFTFGSVTPGSSLSVNGKEVTVHKNGAFLAFLPFSTGTFTLNYEAKNKSGVAMATRTVAVAEFSRTFPEGSVELDENSIYPFKDVELRAGEWLFTGFRASPGLKASFRVKGSPRLAMAEKSPGVYEGAYWVSSKDKGTKRWIEVEAAGAKKKAKARAKGLLHIGVPGEYEVAVASAEVTVSKTAPGKGYDFFLPQGAKVLIAGRFNNEARAVFGAGRFGWVPVDRLYFLPKGTPPPRAVLGTEIRTIPAEDHTAVSIGIDEKVPFRVEADTDPMVLRVVFFNAAGRINWIRYDPADSVVKEIRWRQQDAESCAVEVRTNLSTGWGYDAQYADNKFVLTIRRPPSLPPEVPVLKGKKIALDPGHSPGVAFDGALGPMGSLEPDVALSMALKLKKMLEAEGASVVMTRVSSETVNLMERPKIAWKERADVFVSVHANAMAEEEDPFSKDRGFMMFYYHPHSFALAKAMRKSYQRFRVPGLRGGSPALVDEGYQYGDLAVIRMTQMPAVLTESAYLMLPEQEALLTNPKFQQLFADAMRDGLRAFFEEARQIQLRHPAERRAARK